MLNAIIRFALRNRLLVVVASLAVLVYGGYVTTTLPIDVFPDLDRPRVAVLTECLGLATEEVERDITVHLDSALMGAAGVQMVRSQSTNGLSIVIVEFDWETPIYIARQVVQERLTTALSMLPGDRPDIRPQLAPIGSILGQIMLIGLYHRQGPNGGTLAPVGTTHLVAELVVANGRQMLNFWNPRDDKQRRIEDPSKWRAVKVAYASSGRSRSRLAEDEFTATVDGRSQRIVFVPEVQRLMELRTLADWVLRRRLLDISGVSQVVSMGGGRKQYQVLIDTSKLKQYDLTLEDVDQALRKNNINMSGGYAERGNEEQPIRFLGRLGENAEQVLRGLRQIPIKVTAERTILLEQLAEVTVGPQLKRGDAAINGQFGVLLTVFRQPHVDTRRVTDHILTALDELENTLSADIVINPDFFQMKRFIDRGVYNVAEALVIGAVLVLLILFLFLLNFRTTFISLTAIPISLCMTALVFKLISWLTGTPLSINVMTLGGIAVALGELVDDAIVDVENIFRRLREARSAELGARSLSDTSSALRAPRSALQVIYAASVEIRSAIVFGTAMVILVFLPLFALSGIEGRMFAPLGIAYIVSILASLLVSLTVTPALSYYLLRNAPVVHRQGDSPLLRGLKWLASYLIRFSLAQPVLVFAVSILFLAGSVWMFLQLGTQFLPEFDEGTVQVSVDLPAGASLEASNRISAQVEARLKTFLKTPANPEGEILGILRRTGRSEMEEHADPVNYNEFYLAIDPHSSLTRQQIKEKVFKDLEDSVPGVNIEVEQPLAHLINEMISGSTAQIAIQIQGDELETLRRIAEDVKRAVGSVEGITPPIIEGMDYVTEIHIHPRRSDLAFYGIDAEHLAQFVGTALNGRVVSQVVQGQQRFDLVLRLAEAERTNYTNIGRLLIDLPLGKGSVPLSALVDIDTQGKGPNQIKRDNGRRRLVVRVSTMGRDLGSVAADIQERVNKVARPVGYFIRLGGQFESQQRATFVITILFAVAIVGMFLVLYMLYPSARIVLQILYALPMAFIGGVLALVITQQNLTVAGYVGFISLAGVAARNGILLVSHYFHLMKHEGESFTPAMILRGSLERLSPVLMTAMTAAIALVPLVLGGQQPGREILYPVATVILGGLITSTLCEFLIHPGLFWCFSGKDAARVAEAGEEHDFALRQPAE